jgi:hypothetical protein
MATGIVQRVASITREALVPNLVSAKQIAFQQEKADTVGNLVQKAAMLLGWVEKTDQTTHDDPRS